MKRRIGILTSGGDCPGLNATIRGVAKAVYHHFGDDVQIVGINDGYYGLINNMCRDMTPNEFSGILTTGGTIFGTLGAMLVVPAMVVGLNRRKG
jgi:6-phosphofructokinase 1